MKINFELNLPLYVKCKRPDDEDCLIVGNYYEVKNISMSQSSTSVWIDFNGNDYCPNFAGLWGNSCAFSFYHKVKNEFKRVDIFNSGLLNTNYGVRYNYKMLNYIDDGDDD